MKFELMVKPHEIAQALAEITDRTSLLQILLADTLGWPIQPEAEQLSDIAFGWSAEKPYRFFFVYEAES